MAGIGTGLCYHESHKDGPAVQRFLVVEFASAILEFANGGLTEGTVACVREIEAPLVRLRVIESQAQAFKVPLRAVHLKLHEIGNAAPDLADRRDAIALHPSGGPGQWMDQALEMGFPCADLKVEVMLAISQGCMRRIGSAGTCLCHRVK